MRICRCGARIKSKKKLCSECIKTKQRRVKYNDGQRKANSEYAKYHVGIHFEELFQETLASCI